MNQQQQQQQQQHSNINICINQRRAQVNKVIMRNTDRGIISFVLSELMIPDASGFHSFLLMTVFSFVRYSNSSSIELKDRPLSKSESVIEACYIS